MSVVSHGTSSAPGAADSTASWTMRFPGVRPHRRGARADKIGAGDAFAGALAVGLVEGRDGLEAARMAVAAADIAVTDHGSQQAYPDRRRLDERLACVTAERGITPARDRSSAGR